MTRKIGATLWDSGRDFSLNNRSEFFSKYRQHQPPCTPFMPYHFPFSKKITGIVRPDFSAPPPGGGGVN